MNGVNNVALGFFLCLLLAGVGAGGYYVGHQKGFSEGSTAGYSLGYNAGKTPTNDDIQKQNKQKSIVDDLYSITTDYKQMSDLCEQKYQYGLNGNMNAAMQTKGQITALQQQIDTIMSKYGNNNQDQQNNASLQ